MISLNSFYYILYDHLFKQINTIPFYFLPFGSTKPEDLSGSNIVCWHSYPDSWSNVLFYDQEPIQKENFKNVIEYHRGNFKNRDWNIQFLANSEISQIKKNICKKYRFLDFYYFFHGFLSLYWFNDGKYMSDNSYWSHDYICFNHLHHSVRNYRLSLVANLMEQDILDKGLVSLHLAKNSKDLLKHELFYEYSNLSSNNKKLIAKHILPLDKSLTIDDCAISGEMSSHFDHNILKLWQKGFFHVVTETVFYDNKLHLTEKIFKPIIAKRPFILVGAHNNLKYLKSYGFKTFDKWIDESYDDEQDPDLRMEKIVFEIKKITLLSKEQKIKMQHEMQSTLDYNFNHFYNEFKKIIVTELVDNFETCIKQWNTTTYNQIVDLNEFNFDNIKKILSQ